MKDVVIAIVGALAGFATAIIVARYTTQRSSAAEREKWQRELAARYADAAGTDIRRAQALARQYAVGVFLLDDPHGHGRERLFIPAFCNLVIGRGDHADIKLDALRLSREHLRIVATETTVFIEDLGSTDRTTVERQTAQPMIIEAVRPFQRTELRSGDVVLIGDARLEFQALTAKPF